MKIGLYSKPNRNILTSFADGALALGFSPVWQNPSVFTPDQTAEFDFIALWGGAGRQSKSVIDAYAKFKIKTLVFENGYFGAGSHAIGIGKHYWLPDFPCSSDRLRKFNIKFSKEQKKDGYILIIGQSAEHNASLARKAQEIKKLTDRKIVFRPHPSNDYTIDVVENIGGSLDEALSGAFCVVCETSNAANYALMKGVPVFCAENSMVNGCGNHDLSKIETPYFPDDTKLKDYFERLSYAVWDDQEIKDGSALKFYAAIINGEPPIIKKSAAKSVQNLKLKYKNKTAYIIGKGPSLKYLNKDNFDLESGGLIVPLNEAVKIAEAIDFPDSFTIISQQKDGKPECMVKPAKAPLLLHKKESKDWFEEHPERYIFDLKKDYNLKDNGVSVLNGNCCSVIAAIEFAKFAGCKKIVFLCFDSYTDNINDYPEDQRLGKLHSIPERYQHLKDQKVQIPLHTKGLKTEFVKPEKKKENCTVITLTGDRPEAFELCRQYMARQTIAPEQWIVIDDGKKVLPKKLRAGLEYHRRKPLKNDPPHTLRVNMLEALRHVKTDSVIVVEDDDWYREDYLEIQLRHLKDADLVGQNTFFYWNLQERAFHKVKKTNRPAMCLTAFNKPVFNFVKTICENSPGVIESEKEREKIDKGSVDLSLWARFTGKKETFNEGENLCVGIKGVKGREGHTLGHAMVYTGYFELDHDAKMLKKLIGDDVKNYLEV